MKVYERSGKNLFWSIKNSCEVLDKLKSRGFRASSLFTYYFYTLYTTLPHNLIKDKIVDLIERTFQREGSLYVPCNDKKSRKENPQKLSQLSSRSHPRHLVGKRTAQKDVTIDTTSDSQVNSNFPNRWSPASLTFNNYFYLFLYLYIT